MMSTSSISHQKSFPSGQAVAAALSGSVSVSIMSIFSNEVVENSYMPQHTICSSLGAIEIPVSNVTFVIENSKLRAKVSDNDKREYLLPVSCKYIRDTFFARDKNVDELNSIFTDEYVAHLRIWLTRPFSIQENHCYIMLNGFFLCQ
jgi:hypothetical protein